MFDKLESVENRFLELESRLSEGDLSGAEYAKITKERGQLEELVYCYREYKVAKEDLATAEELIRDPDPDMRSMGKEESARYSTLIEELENRLRLLTLPRDPNDDKNVILEVRAGTGGDEAGIFAGDLLRMYQRFADKKGWRTELLSSTESSSGGFKEVVLLVSGDNVFSQMKFEMGVHRVQRIPQTETQGRIHTSACTVAILPEARSWISGAVRRSSSRRFHCRVAALTSPALPGCSSLRARGGRNVYFEKIRVFKAGVLA